MYNFCTLFDSNYLSRGLACYYSLLENCKEGFHLYIFAFDNPCFDFLMNLNLEKTTIVPLAEFEDSELLKVKDGRSKAEYCWTSTSSTILYVIKKYKVESCTYIDSDIYFFASPKPLLDELKNNSILITEHRYSSQYNKEKKSGTYCVQFISFKNNEEGLKALIWWRNKCIEWCYNRYEDGKFGDQLYLEDWLTRFKGVHVLQNMGGGVAPWNVQQYTFYLSNNILKGNEIRTNFQFDLVFYHYHYLRFFNKKYVEFGRRKLTSNVVKLIYLPYLNRLDTISKLICERSNIKNPNGFIDKSVSLKNILLFIYRKIFGIYNVYKIEKLMEKNGLYNKS